MALTIERDDAGRPIATRRNMALTSRRCEAWDPATGQCYSANPADYLCFDEDEPLVSEVTGEPLVLVRIVTTQEAAF
jgi:hypothetical protein